ncbi:MAG: hypothetical protein ACFB03_14955 [Paracoccaceae bacterium]
MGKFNRKKPDFRDHFKPVPSNAMKVHMGQQLANKVAGPSAKAAQNRADAWVGAINWATDKAFDIGVAHTEPDHLRKNAREIEHHLQDSSGVLYARFVIERPVEQTSYKEYIGVQILGGGHSLQDAQARLQAAQDGEQECFSFAERTFCVPRDVMEKASGRDDICTVDNPTGAKKPDGPSLSAVPDYKNLGYSAAVARKMMPVLEKNPKNLAGGFLIKMTSIKRSLIFLTREEWEKIRNR